MTWEPKKSRRRSDRDRHALAAVEEQIRKVRKERKTLLQDNKWGGVDISVDSDNTYLLERRPLSLRVHPERNDNQLYTLFCVTDRDDNSFSVKVSISNNTLFDMVVNREPIELYDIQLVTLEPESKFRGSTIKSITLTRELGRHTKTQRFREGNKDVFVIDIDGGDFMMTIESPVYNVYEWNTNVTKEVNLGVIYESLYKDVYHHYPTENVQIF